LDVRGWEDSTDLVFGLSRHGNSVSKKRKRKKFQEEGVPSSYRSRSRGTIQHTLREGRKLKKKKKKKKKGKGSR